MENIKYVAPSYSLPKQLEAGQMLIWDHHEPLVFNDSIADITEFSGEIAFNSISELKILHKYDCLGALLWKQPGPDGEIYIINNGDKYDENYWDPLAEDEQEPFFTNLGRNLIAVNVGNGMWIEIREQLDNGVWTANTTDPSYSDITNENPLDGYECTKDRLNYNDTNNTIFDICGNIEDKGYRYIMSSKELLKTIFNTGSKNLVRNNIGRLMHIDDTSDIVFVTSVQDNSATDSIYICPISGYIYDAPKTEQNSTLYALKFTD